MLLNVAVVMTNDLVHKKINYNIKCHKRTQKIIKQQTKLKRNIVKNKNDDN